MSVSQSLFIILEVLIGVDCMQALHPGNRDAKVRINAFSQLQLYLRPTDSDGFGNVQMASSVNTDTHYRQVSFSNLRKKR